MWPDLPLEFNVIGTPVSFQSDNPRAKQDWQSNVLAAAQATVEPGSWAFDSSRLSVTMFYFPQAPLPGDLDNIVKLILDALMPNIYIDDSLIDRLVVQRFDPSGTYTFASPSDTLVAAMATPDPVLYVRLAEVSFEDIDP
jgi:crossover junction endodeoxyribonuclease RusA